MRQCDLQLGSSYSATKGWSQTPHISIPLHTIPSPSISSFHATRPAPFPSVHTVPSASPFPAVRPHLSLHSHSLAGFVPIPVFSLTSNIGSVKSPIPHPIIPPCTWVPLTNEETLLPPESAILSTPSPTHTLFSGTSGSLERVNRLPSCLSTNPGQGWNRQGTPWSSVAEQPRAERQGAGFVDDN